MRELLEQIEIWINNGQSVALATVIKTWGSSPRPVGAGMALTAEGGMAGSISGGCVEGAVIDA
ncbi:MAG: XdhC family protein, partial [Anaerolineales bacterium]|nr:XdhC family protein [Anaerolineales bacterium]